MASRKQDYLTSPCLDEQDFCMASFSSSSNFVFVKKCKRRRVKPTGSRVRHEVEQTIQRDKIAIRNIITERKLRTISHTIRFALLTC